jgi:hypothetical protein
MEITCPIPAGVAVVADAGGPRSYRAGSREAGRLVITVRWFYPQLVFLAFFCVAWDSLLFLYYANVGPGSVAAILFPIVHVTGGFVLTCCTIAGFVNRTWIVADRGTLAVRHAPIPWLGNRRVPTAEIEQLHHKQVTRSGHVSYTLAALMKGGQEIDLVTDLRHADQALFLQQRLEDRLGIAPR